MQGMWYVIDAVDRVADMCSSWDAEAERGGAPELTRAAVLGRSIWQYIGDEPTRFQHARVFEAARQSGQLTEIQLRDDLAGHCGVLRMQILPRPDHSLRIDVAELRRPLHRGPSSAAQMSATPAVRLCSCCQEAPLAPGLQASDGDMCPGCASAVENVRASITQYAGKLL